jgi:hypothetical protein
MAKAVEKKVTKAAAQTKAVRKPIVKKTARGR